MLSEEFGDFGLDRMEAYRVVRGGSFWLSALMCRSAYHDGYWAGIPLRGCGFRVCLVRSPFFSDTDSSSPEPTALERRDDATEDRSLGEADES